MLSEIRQTKRTNNVRFHLYEVPSVVKFKRKEVEWGGGIGSNFLMGTVSVWEDEKF